jgi:hypothetical protein
MKELNSASVRIFVVWEPILPTDWSRPSRTVLSRIPEANVVQYWDKGHLIAKELAQQLTNSQEPHCCVSDDTLWDVVALYPQDTSWGSSPPVFIDGPVVRVAPQVSAKLSELLNSRIRAGI